MVGPLFPVVHFHNARFSFLGRNNGTFAVAGNQIFFSLTETTGNIWMAQVKR